MILAVVGLLGRRVGLGNGNYNDNNINANNDLNNNSRARGMIAPRQGHLFSINDLIL